MKASKDFSDFEMFWMICLCNLGLFVLYLSLVFYFKSGLLFGISLAVQSFGNALLIYKGYYDSNSSS